MICKFCKKEIAENSKFCSYCGKSFVMSKKKRIMISLTCLLIVIASCATSIIWYKSTLSPINDVSSEIYARNFEILDEYLDISPTTRKEMRNMQIEDSTFIDEQMVLLEGRFDYIITEKSTDAEKLLIEKTKPLARLHLFDIYMELKAERDIDGASSYIEKIAISGARESSIETIAQVTNEYYSDLLNAKDIDDLKSLKLTLVNR